MNKQEKRVKDLEKEILSFEERQERALERVRAVDEELSVLGVRTHQIALATFDGEQGAVRESEELREKRSHLQHEREISAAAAEQAGQKLPDLEARLKEAEVEAHKAEFDKLQAGREGLYPALEEQVAALAATLKEASDLANQQVRLAPKAGRPNYQQHWHAEAADFLRVRLYDAGILLVWDAGLGLGGRVHGQMNKSQFYGRRLDGKPLGPDKGA